jgi:ketosteroid isomerase-like protein
MSQENVELHIRGLDALNRQDLDALLEVVHPEVVATPLIATVQGTPYRGVTGIHEWWNDLHSAFPDFRVDSGEIRSEGDVTIAPLRATARGAGSEVPVDWPMWHVVEWRDGACVLWQTFSSEGEALEAAGLSE